MGNLEDKLAIKRHSELTGELKNISTLLGSLKPEDQGLKQLLADNKQAISDFTAAIDGLAKKDFGGQSHDGGNEKLAAAISEMATSIAGIMKGIDSRLSALESRPIPVKLKAQRGNYGDIDYVDIVYKKDQDK